MTVRDMVEDVGAVVRLTRLVTQDALLDGARERLLNSRRQAASIGDELALRRRWGADVAAEGGPIAYAVQCGHCSSVWIAGGVVLARRLAPRAWAPVARTLALAAAAGWMIDRA